MIGKERFAKTDVLIQFCIERLAEVSKKGDKKLLSI